MTGKKIEDSFVITYIVQCYIINHHNYVQRYTDSSKTTGKITVGMAYITREFQIEIRNYKPSISVHRGDGSILAVQWVEETKSLKTIISSDSSSTLIEQSLRQPTGHFIGNTTNPIQNTNDGTNRKL